MTKQHDKQFKLDAIQYYQHHKDLGGCAENLGIGYSTLTKWLRRRKLPKRLDAGFPSPEC